MIELVNLIILVLVIIHLVFLFFNMKKCVCYNSTLLLILSAINLVIDPCTFSVVMMVLWGFNCITSFADM